MCVCSETINAGAGVNERAQVSLSLPSLRMSLPASTSLCCLEPPCKVHEIFKVSDSRRASQRQQRAGAQAKNRTLIKFYLCSLCLFCFCFVSFLFFLFFFMCFYFYSNQPYESHVTFLLYLFIICCCLLPSRSHNANSYVADQWVALSVRLWRLSASVRGRGRGLESERGHCLRPPLSLSVALSAFVADIV